MIDRAARNKAISAIEEHLNDKLTAFEFDERLQEIDTDDQAVNVIVHEAWCYYDDCKDHKVHLDAELSSSVTRRWSWDHALAWITLSIFVAIAFIVGWGFQLFLITIPFGVISMLISRYRQRELPELKAHEIACIPFDSYTQIRRLRRKVPGFTKQRYRAEIEGRKVRSEAVASFLNTLSYCYWALFSPIALLAQGFPSCDNYALKLTSASENES